MPTNDDICRLCGLPVGNSNISQQIAGQPAYFCCLGCMYVFQILSNMPGGIPEKYRDTELYKACVSAGIIPSEAGGIRGTSLVGAGSQFAAGSRSYHKGGAFDRQPEVIEGLTQELSLRIEGMWCFACSWLIEQILLKMDGVLSAGIFFFSDIAHIKYMPHLVQPKAIMGAVARLGYRVFPVESPVDSGQSRNLVVRMGISAILSMNAMMIAFALWAGFFEQIGREGAAFFSYTLWIITTPVVFYGGLPIFRNAFTGIRHRSAGMDTLIAAGVLSAYFYSVVAMFRGSLHVYFDTAAMLVTLVLLGRFIEARAREKISGTITALFHAASGKVRTLKGGKEIWTAPNQVSKGDTFLVFAGERVPVDGRIVSGGILVDESIITGESRPVNKAIGADVSAGSLVLDREATFEAARPGKESSLSQMITLIQEALATRNRFETFADRVMRILAPAVLALSALVFIVLLNTSMGAGEAVLRALTVLVITCPCTLGIAVPLAKTATIARARTSGILIRNPAALERTDLLDVVIFDKTGTLTEGRYILRETVTGVGDRRSDVGLEQTLEPSDTEADEALRRVASVEGASDHFLAREIVKTARLKSLELEEVLSFELREGLGVIGSTRSGEVIAGSRELMADSGVEFPDRLGDKAHEFETAGSTVVFFAWDGRVRGFFVFGDRLRDSAAEIVSRLRSEGVSVWIVSGDSEETTRAMAHRAGADNFAGRKRPLDKVAIIADLQARGKRVAMVGDGINDAAALTRADLGITLGTGANLIRECSDAAILVDDLLKIAELFELSRFSFKVTRENLFFSFFYNAFGIPLAAAGFLNPLIAAFAMFASSVTVILNTTRISRYTRKPDPSNSK